MRMYSLLGYTFFSLFIKIFKIVCTYLFCIDCQIFEQKSPAKQFTHTLRKGTMKCLPTTTNRVKGGPGGTGGPGGVGGGVDPNSPDGKMSYGIDSVDGPSVNLQHIM